MKKLLRTWWQGIQRWAREPRVIWRSDTPTIQTTIEIQNWVPFVAFIVTLLWYMVDPTPVALMSAVALGGAGLGSFLWARSMAKGAEGQRRLRFAAMQVGDELEELIVLKNKTALPVIWAEFIDRSNIPGYTVSSARAADPSSKVEWRAHTICTRRGVYSLGPWELRLGEPLGFLLVRQLYLQRQDILVYPPLAVLPEQFLPHRGALGDHRPLNQPLQAETIASTSVRAYVAGDPLRHIHWRTSARRAEPFVKVFAPEAASNVWIVPDFNASAHLGEGDRSSQEMMVTVAASLASALLQQNLSVGLFASAGQETAGQGTTAQGTVVLPRQGQAHLWTILQALAPLHTAPQALEETLTRARGLVGGNDLLILVTPSLSPDWMGALRRISRSRGSGGRAEVVLLDPDSFDPRIGRQAAEKFIPLLLEQGITANILRSEDIQLISGYYGEVSRWEFIVSGTGKVVTRRAPRAANPLSESSQSARWKPME